MSTKLLQAIKNGDVTAARAALKGGWLGGPPDVNARLSLGYTMLQLAVMQDHPSVAQLLLEHGADVNAANHHGFTALHFAARRGNKSMVELLLAHGAKVNARRSDATHPGATPLIEAACGEYVDVVQLLLSNGADVNATDDNGFSALHGAARSGCCTTIAALLNAGAQVDMKDVGGLTPVEYAVERRNIAAESLLRQRPPTAGDQVKAICPKCGSWSYFTFSTSSDHPMPIHCGMTLINLQIVT